MAGVVVQNTVVNPGGEPYAHGLVHIELVTGTDGGAGYITAESIIDRFTTQTDATGAWTATLQPNTSITPANTYYRVTEGSTVSLITVPASGGPYALPSILATAPPTPSAPGITGVQVAVGGTVEGSRPEVNLIAGTGITLAAADNPAANRVDVTVNATGGGTSGALLAANNLSDVASAATSRTNLGLGGAAVLNVGTATSTVAAGDDSRITGAAQKAQNLADLANVGTARTNLGLGSAALLSSAAVAQTANNLSDLPNAATARSNLGLPGAVPYLWDTPAQRGWTEWNFPPSPQVAVSQNLGSGTVYGVSLIAQTNATISKVGVQVVSSASTPTAGENLIGLYTVSGNTATQQTATGDLSTWGSAGFQSYALGAPQTLVAGSTIILLVLSVATSAVHLQGVTSDTAAQIGFLNLGLSNSAAPWFKFFVYGLSQTSLPASFTISGSTMSATNALAPWACLL